MKLLTDLLWGYHVLGLILLTGIRLTLSGRFFQVRRFFSWLSYSLFPAGRGARKEKDPGEKREKGVSPFGALTAALAGSIGTGNIVGVAAAITVGGAGAIFWMWLSAFFGMMTVFAEVVLAALHKNETGRARGAFAYLEKIGKGRGKNILPLIYGAGCVLSSLSMGDMAQANAVAKGMEQFSVPLPVTGAFLGVFLFFLTRRGLRGVAKLTEKLVPLMALLFFVLSGLCLFRFRERIPGAFCEIMDSAFSLRAGLGGGMFLAMKTGVSRGVFTNEAGLGSSSMAFCEAEGLPPVKLGYLGMFQVFADTIVMCLVTGLCILCATPQRQGEYLALTAFESALGPAGKTLFTACMVLFAFATMTATCYYGRVGLEYLSRGKLTFLFPYLFGGCAFLGSVLEISGILPVCDAFNGLMAIPNLIGLAVFTPQVIRLIRQEDAKKAAGKAARKRKKGPNFSP